MGILGGLVGRDGCFEGIVDLIIILIVLEFLCCCVFVDNKKHHVC
ncbi:MAG: hypothetical protein ACOX4L_08650 [Bacillota bacterium]|jgi:hypothetical protein